MYTVREVIELVSYTAPDWPPERILLVINEVDREMMRGNTEVVEFIDPFTGLPYELETTDGTLFYTMPANCRKIKDVLVRTANMTESYNQNYAYKQITYIGEVWYSLLNVKTYPLGFVRVNNENRAALTFPGNPGTTTGLYYVPYWADPAEITSINSILNVPDDYQGLLVEGVIARIQGYQYGNPEAYNDWKERMKMEVWGDHNYNPPQNNFSVSRPC